MGFSNQKLKNIWQNGVECDCGYPDCHPNNHRLCYLCKDLILFGSYWQNNSKYAWDVDHFIPKSKNGSNHVENLKPCCIECNRRKGNK